MHAWFVAIVSLGKDAILAVVLAEKKHILDYRDTMFGKGSKRDLRSAKQLIVVFYVEASRFFRRQGATSTASALGLLDELTVIPFLTPLCRAARSPLGQDQLLRIEVELAIKPGSPAFQDVRPRPVLLQCMCGLF